MDYYVLQILNCDSQQVLCTLRCSCIELSDVIGSATRSGYLVLVQPSLFGTLKEVTGELKPVQFKNTVE